MRPSLFSGERVTVGADRLAATVSLIDTRRRVALVKIMSTGREIQVSYSDVHRDGELPDYSDEIHGDTSW